MNKYADHVVCYLDVLGYKELVKKYKDDIDSIISLKKSFDNLLDLLKKLQAVPIELVQPIYKSIRITILSDSIIVSMPLEGFSRLDKEHTEEDDKLMYLFIFFMTVVEVYKIAASQMGFLLRGSIVKGLHFEEKISSSDNHFIFSPALVDAFELEKSALYPRVLVDKSISSYVSDIKAKKQRKMHSQLNNDLIYIDHLGIRCLDIFPVLDERHEQEEKYLSQIKDNIVKQINDNRTNPAVMDKYQYFITYMNAKVMPFSKFNKFKIQLESRGDLP